MKITKMFVYNLLIIVYASIFISNSTWFEKKKFFVNNFPKTSQQKVTIYVNVVGKKWLNFVQMTNNVFTDQ